MNEERILVVDDDPNGRKLLANYLNRGGYDVLLASSGEEALEVVADDRPAVVLLDVMMPGMTGLEVCKRIKDDPRARLTQIMMVTALGEEESRVEGLDTGADDYIAKPVARAEFLAKVRALVRARRLLEELEQARQNLENKNRELELKKQLAQALVHDLKNPLTAVVGSLDLLAMQHELSDSAPFERAREGARRIGVMIMDLLDVECLEDGVLEPDVRESDLRSTVEQTLEPFRGIAEAAGVGLQLQLADEPCRAEFDEGLMRRVLDNLIANAIGISREGMQVTVTTDLCPEGVELKVEDQGPGIPADQREAIFEKYHRLEQTGFSSRKNRGLGLSFCQLAIEAHGGSIWVEGNGSGGATFRIVLPEVEQAPAPGTEDPDCVLFTEDPASAPGLANPAG